jgi:hypothetical protein
MRDMLSKFGVRIINLMEMCFCREWRVTEGEKLSWYKDICTHIVRKNFLIELMMSHFAIGLLILDKIPPKQVHLHFVASPTSFGLSRPSSDKVYKI